LGDLGFIVVILDKHLGGDVLVDLNWIIVLFLIIYVGIQVRIVLEATINPENVLMEKNQILVLVLGQVLVSNKN
jgi:hypothetical protein